MICSAWHKAAGLITSAVLAVGFLMFVGVWSMLATLVPQGDASLPSVSAWASAHSFVEPLVRAIGLHHAFTAPVFLACVFLLALSTAACAWRRTKAALRRARTLRGAFGADKTSVVGRHNLQIMCDPDLDDSQILTIAAETLARLGLKTKRRDDLLSTVSSPWSVWGSPVFHWALFALMVVVLVGNLLRSDGIIAVTVGQTRADAKASYAVLRTGPLHDWNNVKRSFRVDAFDPDYSIGGIDRGPVPTVSVLDGSGNAVKTQRVYPNMMLHAGSVAINAPAYGLSATIALVGMDGSEIGRSTQLIDFSQTATGGTVPVGGLGITESSGGQLKILVTVPLEGTPGHFIERIPTSPSARVVVTSADGASLVDRLVKPSEDVTLPGGGAVRLVDVGWYARLSIVDDPTTPLVYATMIMAILGLATVVFARQQLVLATVIEDSESRRFVMDLRLWRNASTTRGEIESELIAVLHIEEKESAS